MDYVVKYNGQRFRSQQTLQKANLELRRTAFLNHLSIANGSLAELETHILIALKLNYVTEQSSQPPLSLIEEVRRMLAGLRSSLKRRLNSAES